MRITHNASSTPPGYGRRYYWLLARPRCPGSELPSWSQCAMSSVRARTLHSPRSVHAAHYARLLTLHSGQAPAALGASVNGRVITSETEIDVVSVWKTSVCFCIRFIFWIESNLNIVSYWIEQLYSKLMEMTLECIQRESFSTYTNLFSSNISKHNVERTSWILFPFHVP